MHSGHSGHSHQPRIKRYESDSVILILVGATAAYRLLWLLLGAFGRLCSDLGLLTHFLSRRTCISAVDVLTGKMRTRSTHVLFKTSQCKKPVVK